MLARNSYEQQYIEESRARIDARVAAYEKLARAARKAGLYSQLDRFEPLFFDTLVLALDNLFVHRQRGMEPKNGALKQVRAMTEADDGVAPEAFDQLADQFFEEIRATYG